MANKENNQKANEVKTEEVQNQETAQQVNAQPAPVQQQTAAPEEKKGFGAWLKKHWKGVTAGATALVAAGGSAFVAYKKGKAAGMAVPCAQQDAEDYSLNPNE